jgi:hypothetical protein
MKFRSKLILSASVLLSIVVFAQERISEGGIVYNYVGRVYISPDGTGQVAGYFPSIAGIDNPFNGLPSEATAYFTYRSEPLNFTAVPADGDTQITILAAGKWHIYFNANPGGNWNDPSSFSQGQLVADLNHNALELVSDGPVHQAVFAGDLLAAYDFTYAGKKINFAALFPDGITNFSSATNTDIPTAGFAVVFPDAGWGVAKGQARRW